MAEQKTASDLVAAADPGWQVYFAYGSNLHLGQMDTRCPESRYVGIGRLHGFHWQINERGYANVVPEEGRFVDGICYLLNSENEECLDKYEGVNFGAYEKRVLDVEVNCRPVALVGRDVTMIYDDRLLDEVKVAGAKPNELSACTRDINRGHLGGGDMVQALVYLSPKYTMDGAPCDEYIDRIHKGIKDSIALGISEAYVKDAMLPWLPSSKDRSNLEDRENFE